MYIYLFVLTSSFCISVVLFPVAKWLAYRYNVMDIPGARNIHIRPVPRTGGLILILSLLSVVTISRLLPSAFIPRIYIANWQIISFIFIFIVGFIDDIFSLKIHIRFSLQSLAAISFVILSGMYLTDDGIITLPPVIAIPFTVFCIIGVINAYNIIDGLDGLCAGCGLVFFGLTACISYIYNDQTLVLFTVLFAGCLLGFIIFNFPSAKIFLGDGGSYLIGFSVATVAIIVLKRHPEISPWALLLMAFIPVYDILSAILRRIVRKRSPFMPDTGHLHHILRRRYVSDTKAVIVLWLIQILMGAIAIFFHKDTLILMAITLLSIVFLRRLWLRQINIAGFRI